MTDLERELAEGPLRCNCGFSEGRGGVGHDWACHYRLLPAVAAFSVAREHGHAHSCRATYETLQTTGRERDALRTQLAKNEAQYIAVVNGRRTFREMYRKAREEIKVLTLERDVSTGLAQTAAAENAKLRAQVATLTAENERLRDLLERFADALAVESGAYSDLHNEVDSALDAVKGEK